MNKQTFKPETEERPFMIVIGIFSLYFLVLGFIFYLFFLHRISLLVTVIFTLFFTLIYIPRFLILKKLANKDNIKIIDDYIMINNTSINLSEIKDYKIIKSKPAVIFVINNKIAVYQEAEFFLKTVNEQISFKVIGAEKITLLEKFLNEYTKK